MNNLKINVAAANCYGITYKSDNYIVAGISYDDKEEVIVKDISNGVWEEVKFIIKDSFFLYMIMLLGILIVSYVSYDVFQEILRRNNIFSNYYLALSIVLIVLVIVWCKREIRKHGVECAMYHSAEHKLENAIKKYGKIPDDIELIKKCSSFHTRCGVRIISNFAFFVLIFSILSYFTNFMPPLFLILFVTLFINVSLNPLSLFIQLFITTKEPDDDRYIRVAIMARKRLCELESGDGVLFKELSIKEQRNIVFNSSSFCEMLEESKYEYLFDNVYISRRRKIEEIVFSNPAFRIYNQ